MFVHKLLHKSDPSLNISAPVSFKLYGVEIHKLPVGKYIQVMRTLNDLPQLLIDEAFPDCINVTELIAYLNNFDQKKVIDVVVRLLTVVPEQACRIISNLLDIPEERLLDPEAPDALSLNELTQILIAFWKINDLSDFFVTVRRLMEKAGAQNTGSNAGSLSLKASGSANRN